MIRHAVLALGMLLLAVGVRYPDPGVPKAGRIIIDDSHSFEWEQAARRLDEQFFGDFATYSYATMAEHLSRCYDVAVVASRESFLASIDTCDVLVIKTPEVDYSPLEVDRIHAFVRAGGGLFVIGDHTDLFGMNARLNQVIAPMGLHLRADSVRNATNQYFVETVPTWLARHPALSTIDTYTFMTGCSVAADDPSALILSGVDAVTGPADYINSSAFPSWSGDPAGPCARVGVVAARTWGAGRVVVCTDGTPFSSFDYYKRNYSDIATSQIEWLNRSNGPAWMGASIAALGLFVALLSALHGGARRVGSPGSVLSMTVGVYVGLFTVTALGKLYYPRVQEFAAPPSVCFVFPGTYAVFPASLGSPGPVDEEAVFDTLYNVPLRLGRRCRLVAGVDEMIATRCGTCVYVNLVDPLDPSSVANLRDWVSNGGQLLVFQRSPLYRSSGLVPLTAEFGISLELNADRTPWIQGCERVPAPNGVVIGRRSIGRGRVDLVISDDAFCNLSLGHSMSIPTERQMELYRTLFQEFGYDGPRWDLCRVRR